MAKSEIAALQYLRGMAATAVVVDHTNGMMAFPKYFGRNNGDFWTSGALGVSIFFVISGFIITLTSLRFDGASFAPAMPFRVFALKRFTRIVPIMWIAIIAYVVARAFGRDSNFDMAYVRAFFLVPFGDVEPNNIWTLRHEAIFYILFAVSFLGPRFRPWIIGAWFVSPLVYASLSLPHEPQSIGMQFFRTVANPCNIEFACGMAIGIAWQKWTHLRTFSVRFPSALLMLGLFALFWVSGYALGLTVDTLYSCIVASVTGGLVVMFAVHLRCTTGQLERLLMYLGEASFSIYLFHLHIASAVLGIWAKKLNGTPPPVVLIGTTLVAMAGAIVIFELVEKPVHRLSYKFLSRSAS